MRNPKLFFIIFLIFFLTGCWNSSRETDEENFEKVQALIQMMEKGGSEMGSQLDSVAHFYERLLTKKDSILRNSGQNKYTFDGAFSNTIPDEDSTLSTLIILNSTPNRQKSEEEVNLTNGLDSVFAKFKYDNPLAVQIYSNSAMQVSRVYPAYDAKNIVDPDIDVRSFNFYYEGDSVHNPEKGLVWIPDAYVDPAGKGWILSLLHPVYDGNELFAVVGVDYTVGAIIEQYLESKEGEFLLVNEKGDIVAGNANAIEALSMPPLKNHIYRETVLSDNFRISDFNLFNSKSREVRAMGKEFLLQKKNRFQFKDEPTLDYAFCGQFSSIGWYLIQVFPSE